MAYELVDNPNDLKITYEHWLPIAGYEGCYEVSDQGRVRSLERLSSIGRRVNGRVLKPMFGGGPKYYSVALHRDGVRDVRKVHHLVLEAFVGGRPDGMLGLHGNDIKTDNRLLNLRWGTGSENQYDAVRNGRHAQSLKTHCRNGHPLAGDSLYITPEGERQCRECNRGAVRRYKRRQMAKAGADG